MPGWYWWAVGALMVVLAVGVDSALPPRSHGRPRFAVGLAVATGAAVRGQFRQARLRNGLLDGRGVTAILGFVALIVGAPSGSPSPCERAGSITRRRGLRGRRLAMGLGGPVLMRTLRRIMLGNRAGFPR